MGKTKNYTDLNLFSVLITFFSGLDDCNLLCLEFLLDKTCLLIDKSLGLWFKGRSITVKD